MIIAGVLALWSAGICAGQDYINTRKISLLRGDTTIIAGILADARIERINPAVYYYWYGQSQILSNQGGHGGNLLHGEYVEYGPSGVLLLKGKFYMGKQSGNWMYWYDNGALKESIRYSQGLLEGKNTRYTQKGKIYFQANYRNARLHGDMTTVIGDTLFQIKYKNGEEQKREALHVFLDQK